MKIKDDLRIISAIARQVSSCYASHLHNDVFAEGCLAYLDAQQRYDTGREIRFWSYAYLRVKGAMLDAIRSEYKRGIVRSQNTDRLLRVSDCVKEDGDDTSIVLAPEAPTMIRTVSSKVGSISSIQPRSVESQITSKELVRAIAKVLNVLPSQDRRILLLYYCRGFSKAKIARMFGMSQGKVTTILQKACRMLKIKLEYIGYSLEDFF